MPFYKFGDNDIIYNRIKAHPKCNFIILNKKIHYNNNTHVTGQISQTSLKHVPTGSISLYEINVDSFALSGSYLGREPIRFNSPT